MTEIENFLDKNICKYLIDFFNSVDENKISTHRTRMIVKLKDFIDDPTINNVFKLYEKLRPFEYLFNIELIKWPVGEFHPYHIDNGYHVNGSNYDTTTITNLNEDYIGGITWVQNYEIKPKIGKIVIFNAWLEHKVTKLEKNERYVILAWYRKSRRGYA